MVIYSWSTWGTKQSYAVSTYSDKKITFSIKTVWHSCDLKGKAHWVVPSCKCYHIYRVWENCSVKVFAKPDNHPISQPDSWSLNTGLYTDSRISCVNKSWSCPHVQQSYEVFNFLQLQFWIIYIQTLTTCCMSKSVQVKGCTSEMGSKLQYPCLQWKAIMPLT